MNANNSNSLINGDYLNLKRLCKRLNLGELTEDITPIEGAFANSVYRVVTTHGKYAVKKLNPIYSTSSVSNYDRFETSELAAQIASEKISAVPAIRFGDKFVQQLDGHAYLIYNWVNADCLSLEEITVAHAEKLGETLAEIHLIDYSQALGGGGESLKRTLFRLKTIDWQDCLSRGKKQGKKWTETLESNIDRLREIDLATAGCRAVLANLDNVFTHGDLGMSNLLWNGNEIIVIDWENFGTKNLGLDIATVIKFALDTDDTRLIPHRKKLTTALINGYNKYKKLPPFDWRMLFNAFVAFRLDYTFFLMNCSMDEIYSYSEKQKYEDLANLFIKKVMLNYSNIDMWSQILTEICGDRHVDTIISSLDIITAEYNMLADENKRLKTLDGIINIVIREKVGISLMRYSKLYNVCRRIYHFIKGK